MYRKKSRDCTACSSLRLAALCAVLVSVHVRCSRRQVCVATALLSVPWDSSALQCSYAIGVDMRALWSLCMYCLAAPLTPCAPAVVVMQAVPLQGRGHPRHPDRVMERGRAAWS
jgi:hypothetical protein